MHNTLENKKKFTALYYGQQILRFAGWQNDFDILEVDGSYHRGYKAHPTSVDSFSYLEVKDIESITKKDLEEIGFVFNNGFKGVKIDFTFDDYNAHWTAYKDGIYNSSGYLILKDFDYLRSKGYALPWMGTSIKKQLKYGWIKFKNKGG